MVFVHMPSALPHLAGLSDPLIVAVSLAVVWLLLNRAYARLGVR